MASKVLATGQKTVQFSSEWCEAFENTDLTLCFRDYRQPYPTMVVELPSNYAQVKYVPGDGDYPAFVAVHHEEQEQCVLFEAVFTNSQMTTLIPYSIDDEIESALQKVDVVPFDDIGFNYEGTEAYLIPFFRIALNAMVSMTYGTEWEKLEQSKAEQQARKRLSQQTHGKDKAAAIKAGLRLKSMPETFRFSQTIEVFKSEKTATDRVSVSTGVSRKPHWRRGHWRQQAIGQGRTAREMRWIRPMLINAKQFQGDLKDTSTTYVTKAP